jgi:hypothetical protein
LKILYKRLIHCVPTIKQRMMLENKDISGRYAALPGLGAAEWDLLTPGSSPVFDGIVNWGYLRSRLRRYLLPPG